MICTDSRIVIAEGPREVHGAAHFCAHHSDFPENWTQGATPAIAAHHLLNLFERNLDSVGSRSRREAIERAMADVRASLVNLEHG